MDMMRRTFVTCLGPAGALFAGNVALTQRLGHRILNCPRAHAGLGRHLADAQIANALTLSSRGTMKARTNMPGRGQSVSTSAV